jgi:ribose 5-phosphate isomerase A
VSINTDSAKDRAARAGASLVKDGMIVGLGSGSTSLLMVRHLAARMAAERLTITGVPSSTGTAELARELKIPLCDLDAVDRLDINLDGADEIDPQFRMIKGRGGALLREKIVACAASLHVTMITADKQVDCLGRGMPIPVEVSRFGLAHTERHIRDLGAATTLRCNADGAPFVTDGGNVIIDCRFADIDDFAALDGRLQCLAGVLDTGLFIGLCDILIVGSDNGVETIHTRVAR